MASSSKGLGQRLGINLEQRMTFLLVTHDPRLAQPCDRIIEVVDGRIVSDRREQPGPS